MHPKSLTPWGTWVAKQPKGVLTRAARATKLAWCVVSKAQKQLVSEHSAKKLAKFAGGAFSPESMTKADGRGWRRIK